jgi:hypothetical protein
VNINIIFGSCLLGEIITKPVYTSDNKHVGHVDGLEADQFIVKDKIIHSKYYRMDRELLETYQDGKVKLRINEQELKSKYEKDNRGILVTVHRRRMVTQTHY